MRVIPHFLSLWRFSEDRESGALLFSGLNSQFAVRRSSDSRLWFSRRGSGRDRVAAEHISSWLAHTLGVRENFIRIALMTESRNVCSDGRAVVLPATVSLLSLHNNLFGLGIGSSVKIATDDFYQPADIAAEPTHVLV